MVQVILVVAVIQRHDPILRFEAIRERHPERGKISGLLKEIVPEIIQRRITVDRDGEDVHGASVLVKTVLSASRDEPVIEDPGMMDDDG
jgi:hypothetical protein